MQDSFWQFGAKDAWQWFFIVAKQVICLFQQLCGSFQIIQTSICSSALKIKLKYRFFFFFSSRIWRRFCCSETFLRKNRNSLVFAEKVRISRITKRPARLEIKKEGRMTKKLFDAKKVFCWSTCVGGLPDFRKSRRPNKNIPNKWLKNWYSQYSFFIPNHV